MPASELTATVTLRKDTWWLEPLLTVLGLGGFVVYTTWAALQGAHYEYRNYLSPFYSPLFKPSWWPFSSAILILWAPAGFRLTCYYYRKAYYRSFWLAPPACAVRDAHGRYTGETGFPLILQNIHRYFFYVATLFLIFLWYDAAHAFIFDGRFGIGLGSLIMVVNVSLLTLYSASCHSCRHLCGGSLDCFSTNAVRYRIWSVVSRLNERHMLWAWLSLFSVALTDVYIRLLAMGIILDLRLL
jgi:hypothetical protein